jgi:hypothetical protein
MNRGEGDWGRDDTTLTLAGTLLLVLLLVRVARLIGIFVVAFGYSLRLDDLLIESRINDK